MPTSVSARVSAWLSGLLLDVSRLERAAGLFLVCGLLCMHQSHAASYSADAVKAAFLHRFSAYVEWPPPGPREPFTIGVLGSEGVAGQLEQLLPGLTIKERRAQVRRVDTAAALEGVHILYIGSGSLSGARPILEAARSRPILIVTDDEKGLASGGVINFVQVGRNVRFEVSLPAAERSGLQIDSGLLSVAARVEERPRASTGPGFPLDDGRSLPHRFAVLAMLAGE